MNDILSDGREREPIIIYNDIAYCEWHQTVTLVWDCYCGEEKIPVEVRVYKR